MRITPLPLATLLILVGCDQNQNRFDVKSQEFDQKQSHHYSQQFDNDDTISDEKVENESIENKPSHQIETINDTPELDNVEIPDEKGMFTGLLNMFSSSDEKIDSLDKIINDCEERLYTRTDEANSQQGAINSLISERNNLLKQLDSLQTTMVLSKKTSNRRLVELESNQRKLKSLIEILSTEIE